MKSVVTAELYIGAMPGRIIQGMRKAKVVNPVFLIDEIDKMSSNYRGDPSSAMLEVLDPEQNKYFSDHYLEEAYDLSKVMFIATANYLDYIPDALRDRMEIVQLSSYIEEEKLQNRQTTLGCSPLRSMDSPKQILKVTDGALKDMIRRYTREAGVRQLERLIGSLCRKSVRKILEKGEYNEIVINNKNSIEYLAKPL